MVEVFSLIVLIVTAFKMSNAFGRLDTTMQSPSEMLTKNFIYFPDSLVTEFMLIQG